MGAKPRVQAQARTKKAGGRERQLCEWQRETRADSMGARRTVRGIAQEEEHGVTVQTPTQEGQEECNNPEEQGRSLCRARRGSCCVSESRREWHECVHGARKSASSASVNAKVLQPLCADPCT